MLDEHRGARSRERDATEHRLRQFLADASHELRTPLTSIQGFAELFRVGGENDHVDLRHHHAPHRGGVGPDEGPRRGPAAAGPPRRDPPGRARRRSTWPCWPPTPAATRSPPIRAGRSPWTPPDPVIVLGDEDHLRQAIANLVSNALAPHAAGTPIEVSARRGATAAPWWSSATTAPGLDADALDHVFDRFWRADRARVGSGSGLGLSIVAAIAQEHGGDISVANADGGGARFELTLPPP